MEEKRRRLGPHPGEEELVAYHAGEMGLEESKRVQDHLVLCPQCAKLLLDLDAFAADAAVPDADLAAPRRRNEGRRWLVPLAVAASILILVLAWPSPEPLPAYSANLSGNVQPLRSPSLDAVDEIADFTPGSRISFLLQPETAPDPVPTARAYLRRDGEFRALSAAMVGVDSQGVISLRGRVGSEVLLPQGESDIILVAARPGSLPSRDRLRAELRGSLRAGSEYWIALGRKIRVLESSDPEPSAEPLDGWVTYSGCRTVVSGPTCILEEERRLNLWVRHPPKAEIRIHAGVRRTSYPRIEAGEGFRYEIRVGRTKQVVVEAIQEEERSIWALEVSDDPPSARKSSSLSDRIKDAAGRSYFLIEDRRLSAARELLSSLSADPTGGHVESLYFLAFYRSLVAEEMGDLRTARPLMEQAAAQADRAGLTRFWLLAADLLARQLSTAGLDAAGAAMYAGMKNRLEAGCKAESGESEVTPCDCARIALNRAWVGLLAAEAGRPPDGPLPATLLQEAERIFLRENQSEEGCVLAEDLPNTRLNLALAALQEGDYAAAEKYLTSARIDPAALPRLALWQLDIEARIRLHEAPGRALELYQDLGKRARKDASPEAAWRAAFGRAEALQRLGRSEEALDACAAVDASLDQEALLVPMDARARFIAQRQRASRFCLGLLLRAERLDEALELIRRSAARALSNLFNSAAIAGMDGDARRRAVELRLQIDSAWAQIWKGVPLDQEARLRKRTTELRRTLRGLLDRSQSHSNDGGFLASSPFPPEKGMLLLAYHPLARGEWVAIAADDRGAKARRFSSLPPVEEGEAIASLLLAPFAEMIRRAEEIRVIPFGQLRAIAFHTLPFGQDGRILIDQAPVVYHLDLPARSVEGIPSSSALIAVGPELVEARSEAERIKRVLDESLHGPVELLEDEAAAAGQVRRRLKDVQLFHFAGHARFDPDNGGWDSYLVLSGGTRLTVDDILTSPRVPRWVVLSSCESGRDLRTTPIPGIGLAQAFLVAGAEAAVASPVPVSDRDAAVLMEALYRHWGPSIPVATALRKAQLELRDRSSTADWGHFRVWARTSRGRL